MKKLVFGILGILIILSFKAPKDLKNKVINDPPEKFSTLNGFSEAEAKKLVKYCDSTYDHTPKHTQVWFRREIIEAWYELLKADSCKLGINTDGIRIYISRKQPSDSTPIHSNNGIVVVSTFYSGWVPEDGVKVKRHTDYFNHPSDASLFKLSAINGEISLDRNSNNGALLYNTCRCDVTEPCIIASDHDIPRSVAEKMVHRFRGIPIFRTGAINAKAEWFDKDMIRILVAEMQEGKDTGEDKDDGVRIYFARGINNDYTKHKSEFVIVPTRPEIDPATGRTIHKDYFDCAHRQHISQYTDKTDKSAGGFDNGELCPTHCQGITLPQPTP
jgi:hypothetical protein